MSWLPILAKGRKDSIVIIAGAAIRFSAMNFDNFSMSSAALSSLISRIIYFPKILNL
jgi:hypothetical protein